VAFSLGTGELARYVGTHGTERVRSCVIIESLAPTFAKSGDNPTGVDDTAVSAVQQAIVDDRFAWLTALPGDFLNLEDYSLPHARYVEIEGGPHVMCVTHRAEVNAELLAFLADPA